MTLWVILPVTADPVIVFQEAGRSVIFFDDLFPLRRGVSLDTVDHVSVGGVSSY